MLSGFGITPPGTEGYKEEASSLVRLVPRRVNHEYEYTPLASHGRRNRGRRDAPLMRMVVPWGTAGILFTWRSGAGGRMSGARFGLDRTIRSEGRASNVFMMW